MTFIHGEADRGVAKATYQGYLTTMRGDVESDWRAISGRSADVVKMYLCQTSGWCSYGDTVRSEVPLAQLQVALDAPTQFVSIGPKYQFPYVAGAGVHIDGPSQAKLGEYYARAKVAVDSGSGWAPMYPVSASRTGTAVTVNVNVPQGALTIDTTLVTDPGHYGVSYRDGSDNPVAVSSVAVSGSTITFTLASAVAGVAEFGMRSPSPGVAVSAGPTSGARTCFRDSSTDISAVDGSNLYNWMCHSEIAVA
jgi:hypothetical protein